MPPLLTLLPYDPAVALLATSVLGRHRFIRSVTHTNATSRICSPLATAPIATVNPASKNVRWRCGRRVTELPRNHLPPLSPCATVLGIEVVHSSGSKTCTRFRLSLKNVHATQQNTVQRAKRDDQRKHLFYLRDAKTRLKYRNGSWLMSFTAMPLSNLREETAPVLIRSIRKHQHSIHFTRI